MYRGQLWGPDLPRVEVWTESRSLAGVLIDRHVEAELRRHLETSLELRRIAEQSERECLELLGEKVDRDGLTAVLTSTDVKP